VGIYESEEVNAFATGPSRSNSMVAVSTGLLRRLEPDQVEAVLGHEVSHIANGDMVTMTLIQGVINAFVMFFARIVSRIIAQALDEKARFWVEYLLYIVVSIAFTMLGAIVVNYFSRRREFRADAGSAKLLGPQKMISALRALANTQELIDPSTKSAATLKISDRPTSFSLFSTHPPLEERIRALQALAAS
jgi:heat shock protein HtpX